MQQENKLINGDGKNVECYIDFCFRFILLIKHNNLINT